MLPRSSRLTTSEGFRIAVRHGRRAGTGSLVVHWHGEGSAPVEIGFVVSKAVGNAVARNRVKRRLRHLTREHLERLPGRGVLVVRALPESASVGYDVLRADLARALTRVLAPQHAS